MFRSYDLAWQDTFWDHLPNVSLAMRILKRTTYISRITLQFEPWRESQKTRLLQAALEAQR
jgi:hypothetical protein